MSCPASEGDRRLLALCAHGIADKGFAVKIARKTKSLGTTVVVGMFCCWLIGNIS